MKIFIILLSFTFITAYGQMFDTSHGPNIYFNPKTIKEGKVKAIEVKEYLLDENSRVLADEYILLFDTAGKPYKKLAYIGEAKAKLDTLPLKDERSYDSLTYDKNNNIIRIKRFNTDSEYFRYDSLNREIYSCSISNGSMTGPDFSISESKYDSFSRLTRVKVKRGNNFELDTTKVKSATIYSYIYDNEKMMGSSFRTTIYNSSNKSAKTINVKYKFVYQDKILKKVVTDSNLRKEGGVEIELTPIN